MNGVLKLTRVSRAVFAPVQSLISTAFSTSPEPEIPSRAPSAYNLFVREWFKNNKHENIKRADQFRQISYEWLNIQDAEKQRLQSEADKAKEEYQKAMDDVPKEMIDRKRKQRRKRLVELADAKYRRKFGVPVRALSAYVLFIRDHMKKALAKEEPEHKFARAPKHMIAGANLWKTVDQKTKNEYEEKAKKDHEAHDIELTLAVSRILQHENAYDIFMNKIKWTAGEWAIVKELVEVEQAEE